VTQEGIDQPERVPDARVVGCAQAKPRQIQELQAHEPTDGEIFPVAVPDHNAPAHRGLARRGHAQVVAVAQRVGEELQLEAIALVLVHDAGQGHVRAGGTERVAVHALDLRPEAVAGHDETQVADLRAAGGGPVDLVEDAIPEGDPQPARTQRGADQILGARGPGRRDAGPAEGLHQLLPTTLPSLSIPRRTASMAVVHACSVPVVVLFASFSPKDSAALSPRAVSVSVS